MKKEIIRILQKNDVNPSYQRMKIFEFLEKNRTHPTVDEIHAGLSAEIPTLSKTTVYNTLKLLARKDIISYITLEENEIRYDYDKSPHMHLKCRHCGIIYDIFRNCELFHEEEIDGHLVEEHHLYLRGLCKKCRQGCGN